MQMHFMNVMNSIHAQDVKVLVGLSQVHWPSLVVTEILHWTCVYSGTRKPISNGRKALTLLRKQKNGILKYTVVQNLKLTF
jgi:hypothetical protein